MAKRADATASARSKRMTNKSVADALPELLASQDLSLRALASAAGVSQSHLSRALRKGSGRFISGELAERLAIALGLPADYFPETRTWRVHTAIDDDPNLRESVYRGLHR